eukprot:1140883-Pelagomonas_calceolata.AAC.2
MSANVIEAGGEGCCAPCIVFNCDGWTSESKVDFVLPQNGCGSALPELVPFFNGGKGKSIPACKVILRAGCDRKGIGNAGNYIHLIWGVQSSVMVTSTPRTLSLS